MKNLSNWGLKLAFLLLIVLIAIGLALPAYIERSLRTQIAQDPFIQAASLDAKALPSFLFPAALGLEASSLAMPVQPGITELQAGSASIRISAASPFSARFEGQELRLVPTLWNSGAPNSIPASTNDLPKSHNFEGELHYRIENSATYIRNLVFRSDWVGVELPSLEGSAFSDVSASFKEQPDLSGNTSSKSPYRFDFTISEFFLTPDLFKNLPRQREALTRLKNINARGLIWLEKPVRIGQQAEAHPLRHGRLLLDQLAMSWGNATLRASGNLEIDRSGLATGILNLELSSWEEMLIALADMGIVNTDQLRLIRGAANFLGNRNNGGVELPLTFRQGNVFIGPIPIGQHRPL